MKFKKRLAVLLSAAMVMGMTVPAGATALSTNEVPGSDSRTGRGEKEAHLDREVANIILPTISDNAFDFTVDPERLVKATQGARFEAAGQKVEPTAMNDGVFFQVSDNQYDSKTPEFDFENRSTFAIDLTVEVEAEHRIEATDLALLSADEVAVKPAPEAGLYLGLKVGDDLSSAQAKPILYDAPAKTTISVDGIAQNFTVSWDSVQKYHNVEVEEDQQQAWKHCKFQIEGIATEGKEIADETSAPSIKVTWSWKKYGDTSRLSRKSITATNNKLDVTVPDGVTYTVSLQHSDGTEPIALTPDSGYTVSGTTITVPASSIEAWLGMSPAYNKLVFTFSDGEKETVNIK